MFSQGVTVFTIRGIPIKLHISLLLFIPYLAFVATTQFSSIAAALGVPEETMQLPPLVWGIILALGLFCSILAHELAHSLVALRKGLRVRAITLMMLGGVSQIEDDDPDHEAWIAFAGPLMSFGIAAMAYLAYLLASGPSGVSATLLAFSLTNLVLGVFNLLPAFPMDGGRVLRGLLSRRIGRERATQVATSVGKGMAVLLGLGGILSFNLILLFIAVFVYMGATAEQARLGAQAILRGMPVARLMTDRLGEARADESAPAVAERLLRHNLAGARVVGPLRPGDLDRELGVVTAWDLGRMAERGELPLTMAAAIRSDLPRVHARDDASHSIDALTAGDTGAVAVLDETEHVVGLVTPAEIQRAMALLGAVQAGARHLGVAGRPG
ncbi:neutral zinc metallopeptidase [Chondromyces crocatus]|uniref:Zinc metalloprotease n=2 Tax=Chondromyces crocatus TaxID=52 RepID=A0A0K1E877_CHOCO|nr:neutral zinc metallopeptidase [Chondromyces crocatus]